MIKNEQLGTILSRVRQAKNLTQQAVAERAGLTVNYLSLAENGHRGVSTDTLNKIANVFSVPAEILVFLAGDGDPNEGGAEMLQPLISDTKAAIRIMLGIDDE